MLLFLLSNILIAFVNSTTIIATTTSVTAMTSTAVATTTGTANSTTSSLGSCPVTYAPTPTWVSYNTTTDCKVAQYGTTVYYDYLDPCVKTYCENMWNRSVSSYEAGTGELYTTTRTYNQGIYGTGSLSTVITAESYSTTTGTCMRLLSLSNRPTNQFRYQGHWPGLHTPTPLLLSLLHKRTNDPIFLLARSSQYRRPYSNLEP